VRRSGIRYVESRILELSDYLLLNWLMALMMTVLGGECQGAQGTAE
jgi:hypothetical protein